MNDAKKNRPAPEGLVVVNYPDPILKKRAVEVEKLDEWVKGVIARMKTLMVEHEGVGLAAPQVGLGLRLFVWSPTGKGGRCPGDHQSGDIRGRGGRGGRGRMPVFARHTDEGDAVRHAAH